MTNLSEEVLQKRIANFKARMENQARVYTELINEVQTIVRPIIEKYDGKEITKRLTNAMQANQAEGTNIYLSLNASYTSSRYIDLRHRKTYANGVYAEHTQISVTLIYDSGYKLNAAATLALLDTHVESYTHTRDQWLADCKRYKKAMKAAAALDKAIQDYGETYSQELRKEFFIRTAYIA